MEYITKVCTQIILAEGNILSSDKFQAFKYIS